MQLQAYILFIWVFETATAYQLHQIVYGRYKSLPANIPPAPRNTLRSLGQIQNSFESSNAHGNTFSEIFRNAGVSGSFSNFQSHASSGGGNAFSNTISSHGTDRGRTATGYSNFGASSSSYYGKQEQRPPKTSHPAIDCRSDVLSCVPAADCEDNPYKGTAECPPHFIKLGGACYYFSNADFVQERSAPDSRKFCEDLGGHLLWLENANEFESLSQVIAEKGNLIYWSDGFYNKRKDQWEWYNNTQRVDIRRLHYESYLSKPRLNSPSPNTQCLLIGSGIDAGYCYSTQPFVCKIGEYTNYCERSSLKKCCWSPSYEYYRSSRLGLTPVTIGLLPASSCYVLFNMEIVTCEVAFKSLGYSAFRIKKSIYYLKSADLGCGNDLEAVISSKDVHRNIVHLMMLRELRPFKVKIGLKFQPSTYSGSFVWSNGKSVDYYEVNHWGSGQPIIYGTSSCVMYQLTGTFGSYLWHTQSDSRECTHPNNYVLCELPVRNKKEEPVKKEEGCGIRKTRGALARSFLANHDYEEAKLGEMPWHVAIQRAVVNSGKVRQEFLCSGVLVSKNSILTSAHCVQGRQRELIVSLGENDLLSGSRRKLLQPVSRTVREVVIHPQYSSGKNDLAILQLSYSVDIPSLPHVSTTCLPDQQLLNTPGEWECLTTGWQTSASYRQQVLLRIEVEFLPKQVCTRHTAIFSSSHRSDKIYYGQLKSNNPKLLCTEPWDSTTCLDDPTQILICKKTTSSHRQDPFDSNQFEDTGYNNRYQETQTEQYKHKSTNIINTYGENRYNADKWYVIGLGYKASKCEGHNQISVFTPVHEFLAFIDASIDHTLRSPVISSNVPKDEGLNFATDLPVIIPEQTTEKVAETTIAPVTPVASNLANLVSDGEILASRIADLIKIKEILEAVETVFDLLKSAVEKNLQRSVVNDIANLFRKRRSADIDITSIVQKLTELQNTGSQIDNLELNEIKKIILSIKEFIKDIELKNVNDSEVREAKKIYLEAEDKLSSLLKDNQEQISLLLRELATINDDIRNLGGVIVTVPRDSSTDVVLAAAEAAKREVEAAAKLYEEAAEAARKAEEEVAKKVADEELARKAAEEAAEAASKAEEEAAKMAAEEEEARKAAEEAAEAAKKIEEAAAKKLAEEEAAMKAEEAERIRLEREKAEEKARLEKEAAEKKAEDAAEAKRKAEEAKAAAEEAQAEKEAAMKAEKEAEQKAQLEKEAAEKKARLEKEAAEEAESAKKIAEEALAAKGKALKEAAMKAEEEAEKARLEAAEKKAVEAAEAKKKAVEAAEAKKKAEAEAAKKAVEEAEAARLAEEKAAIQAEIERMAEEAAEDADISNNNSNEFTDDNGGSGDIDEDENNTVDDDDADNLGDTSKSGVEDDKNIAVVGGGDEDDGLDPGEIEYDSVGGSNEVVKASDAGNVGDTSKSGVGNEDKDIAVGGGDEDDGLDPGEVEYDSVGDSNEVVKASDAGNVGDTSKSGVEFEFEATNDKIFEVSDENNPDTVATDNIEEQNRDTTKNIGISQALFDELSLKKETISLKKETGTAGDEVAEVSGENLHTNKNLVLSQELLEELMRS